MVLAAVEAAALAHPRAVAVICGDQKVTYKELNERAARIARGLTQKGASPGAPVAVLVNRTPDLIASLLAVWKVGGAYLPLDPSHPAERIAFKIEDAGVRYLLTETGIAERLSLDPLRSVLVDSPLGSGPAPRPASQPGDPAYVIYTSGSTGKPKGSLITHGGLANTVLGIGRELNVKTGDTVLAITTVAFDIACLELIMPLVFGATVYLADTDAVKDGERLAGLLRVSGASLIFGTPTSWRLLLEAGWRGGNGLTVVSGGEGLPTGLARQLANRAEAVWNHYGPTETTICASTFRVPANVEKVGIGKPLANVTLHLLDHGMKPVLAGQIGEIYIGGAGVGLGYLNRPDLTARSFIRDPFESGESARLYKTGDLGRAMADGGIEFLGRTDDQVKIRGFRVELQEVEAAIRKHPAVRDAAVQAFEVEAGDRRIAAHIVTSTPVKPARLKHFLARHLPAYMIPAEIHFRTTLPLSENGKVDRGALANEAKSARRGAAESAGHSKLPELWASALGVGRAGMDDDFFELGGNSLAAARLFAQIRKQMGRRLPLSVLLENPTLRELTAYLEHTQEAPMWAALVALQPRGSKPPLILLPGLGGNVLTFRHFPQYMSPDQPVYGLQLTPETIASASIASIGAIASRFIEEIRDVFPSGPYHFGGYSVGGMLAFEMARQLREANEQVGLLALFDTDYRVFDRSRGWGARLRTWLRKLPVKLRLGWRELARRRLFSIHLKWRLWRVKRLKGMAEREQSGVEDRFALAAEHYDPPPYPGDAVLVMAEEEMVAGEPEHGFGWRRMIKGALTVAETPGDHINLFEEPHVWTLAPNIERMMRMAEDGLRIDERSRTTDVLNSRW